MATESGVNIVDLRKKIAGSFSLAEMSTLCFDLQVEYDNLLTDVFSVRDWLASENLGKRLAAIMYLDWRQYVELLSALLDLLPSERFDAVLPWPSSIPTDTSAAVPGLGRSGPTLRW